MGVARPWASTMVSPGVVALERIEQARKEREDRMRNALVILAEARVSDHGTGRALGQFVRATAREGLGHET